jgi:hypothetical protein
MHRYAYYIRPRPNHVLVCRWAHDIDAPLGEASNSKMNIQTQKPLNMLKKGLSRITQSLKVSKDGLNAKLAQKETISSLDEHWLDHEGNTIDEECVIKTNWLLLGHFRQGTEWTSSLFSMQLVRFMF